MIRIGLYLEPDTRREWFVVRVRATPLLHVFHGVSYLAYRGVGHSIGAWLPRPVLGVVMGVLRCGCWCRPGWLDRAELVTRSECRCCR